MKLLKLLSLGFVQRKLPPVELPKVDLGPPPFSIGAVIENSEYEPVEVVECRPGSDGWIVTTKGLMTGKTATTTPSKGSSKIIRDIEMAKAFYTRISNCRSEQRALELATDYFVENNYVGAV